MSVLPPRFVLGVEHECMTTVEGDGDPRVLGAAMKRLFEHLREGAPGLLGPSGWFNAYGRVYEDCGRHVELASAECDSPYRLASIVERQQRVVEQALRRVAQHGARLRLANNNHSGLLGPASATWGSHDNYLCEVPPATLTHRLLPFLVTRVYAGSGGLLFRSGSYLHAVRPLFMTRITGGGTTGQRAIHSTSRDEPHMGNQPLEFRYHGLLADGHRSQFSLALTIGATALALKVAQVDRELPARLAALGGLGPEAPWLPLLHRFNRLAGPRDEPAVAPRVIEIQRVYLEAAQRYAALLDEPPAWIPRLLADWEDTLVALEHMDRPWLAARLDAFIKYEVLSATLRASGHTRADLRGRRDLFERLALCAQDYHTFDHPACAFEQLERAGVLQHRVAERVEPGAEPAPFVPETGTRATARARFLREHSGEKHLRMDWSSAFDAARSRVHDLRDPFAPDFDPPRALDPDLEGGWLGLRELYAQGARGSVSRLRARLRAMARTRQLEGGELPF